MHSLAGALIGLWGASAAAAEPGLAAVPSTAPPPTGFVWDARFLAHDTGAAHPERPERLTAILARLTEAGLLPSLVRLAPVPATAEQLAAVHEPRYIERVRTTCAQGTPGFVDSSDTPVSADSYAAAVLAAGAVAGAADAVMAGTCRNAFCAVRPPGHHALRDAAMGFCLFNNVAVAARHLQRRHGLQRILIVDWDVHHGNGTQAAFADDPRVLYVSAHRHPFYPGTGAETDTGRGPGRGATLNVNFPAGTGDAAYIRAFEERLVPAADRFRPQFVLVSAGFDAQRGDPLGGMDVTPAGYAALTRIVMRVAAAHAQGRLVSVLEGGYDPDDLARAVEAHLRTLMSAPERTAP